MRFTILGARRIPLDLCGVAVIMPRSTRFNDPLRRCGYFFCVRFGYIFGSLDLQCAVHTHNQRLFSFSRRNWRICAPIEPREARKQITTNIRNAAAHSREHTRVYCTPRRMGGESEHKKKHIIHTTLCGAEFSVHVCQLHNSKFANLLWCTARVCVFFVCECVCTEAMVYSSGFSQYEFGEGWITNTAGLWNGALIT